MEIINRKKSIELNTAVALGNFDGIHLGHKKLIDTMVSMAKKDSLVPSVFTFDYDFHSFKLGNTHTSIVSERQKEKFLEDLGVEILYIADFCEQMKTMEPEEFVRDIMINRLNAKLIVVGFNFKFGHKAKGDTVLLEELSEKYDFKLNIISPVVKDSHLVSSTEIRELIRSGDIRSANIMLGRNYSMEGTVIRGKGRGHKLGFATANLKCDADYVIPKFGVYDSEVIYREKRYRGITNIGANPTFADIVFSIETHLIDFSKDIYGEQIEIELLRFIRPEKKFESVEKLVIQVKKDIEMVKSSDK